MSDKELHQKQQAALDAYNPLFSEWHRERAIENIALREKIAEVGDLALVGLMEERDRLEMNYEMTGEIHGEWAAEARRIAPAEGNGCDCNTCAISRALSKTLETWPHKQDLNAALDVIAQGAMESGQELAEIIEERRAREANH